MTLYFRPGRTSLEFVPADWRPRGGLWGEILRIGLPAGAEFALMSVYLFVVYAVTRPFGSAAQAGFGIGMRVLQAGFMPVVALGFAVAPVAGQNFGARRPERVRETFRTAVVMAAGGMVFFTIVCHLAPAAMVGIFSSDPGVVAVGADYLRIVSWNFVASGVIFVCSSTFQAMGNTVPSLVSSFVRIALVVPGAFLLARLAGFELRWIWYLTVGTVTLQMVLSLLLIRLEFQSRLALAPDAAS